MAETEARFRVSPPTGETRRFSQRELEEIRRGRRHPRPTQFDYLHVRFLVRDLREALAGVDHPVHDVLDLFCGARPYDDLLPAGASVVGLDIENNPYGVADVVTNEFLPFSDQSFDVVMCIQAFYYLPDPARAVSEIHRVLRRGGTAVISVPLVWEYDRATLTHRFTGPELAALFQGWDDVKVVENGGRAVAWATLTSLLVNLIEWHVPGTFGVKRFLRPAFAGAYVLVNGLGLVIDVAERRYARSTRTLPMNLLLTARRSHA
jgi:SAM-dependent methyltransferase